MKTTITKAIALLFCASVGATALAQTAGQNQTRVLTTEEVSVVAKIVGSIKSSPELEAAKAQAEAADSFIDAAKSEYFPRVQLGSSVTNDSLLDSNRQSVYVAIRQVLYAGGRIDAQLDQARANKLISNAVLQRAGEDLLLNVLRSYMNLDRLSYMHKAADAYVKELERQVANEEERKALGAASSSDVFFVMSRLNTAQDTLQDISSRLKSAQTAFERYVGNFGLDYIGNYLPTITIPPEMLPRTESEALTSALFNSSVVKEGEQVIKRAEAQVDVSKAALYPTIELVGIARKFNTQDALGRDNSNSVNVQMTYDAFQGGGPNARIAQSVMQRKSAVQSLEAAKLNLRQQVKDRWERVENTKKRLPILQMAAENGLKVLRERKVLRRYNNADVRVLLDAQQEYYSNLQRAINSIYEAKMARIDLAYVTGKLRIDRTQPARIISKMIGRENLRNSLESLIMAPLSEDGKIQSLEADVLSSADPSDIRENVVYLSQSSVDEIIKEAEQVALTTPTPHHPGDEALALKMEVHPSW